MKKRKPGKRKSASAPRVRIYLVLGFFIVVFGAIFLRAVQLQVIDGPKLKQMAVSIEVDSIFAQPDKIESPRTVAKVLSPILGRPSYEIEKKLRTDSRFAWLKRQVDLKDDQRAIVKELEGVGIIKESRRFFPNRQLASNIIGFTGLDSNGIEGVEKYYDAMLKGSSGRLTGERDALGRGA